MEYYSAVEGMCSGCTHMGEYRKFYVEWRKPNLGMCSIFSSLWKSRTNLWDCNPARWSSSVWEGNTTSRHMQELCRGKATQLLDWMLVPWIYTFLNTHQRVHLRSTHFAIHNYTSIKIWKLHTLITPQLLWIFSWFIKWGVHSNMHFDCIMNMKHADYQFIFLWKPRDRAKTAVGQEDGLTHPSAFSVFSLLSITMVIAFKDFVLLNVIRQKTLDGRCINYSNSCQEKNPRLESTSAPFILLVRKFSLHAGLTDRPHAQKVQCPPQEDCVHSEGDRWHSSSKRINYAQDGCANSFDSVCCFYTLAHLNINTTDSTNFISRFSAYKILCTQSKHLGGK